MSVRIFYCRGPGETAFELSPEVGLVDLDMDDDRVPPFVFDLIPATGFSVFDGVERAVTPEEWDAMGPDGHPDCEQDECLTWDGIWRPATASDLIAAGVLAP